MASPLPTSFNLKDEDQPPFSPRPWKPVWSKTRKRWYFFNTETHQSSWTATPCQVPNANPPTETHFQDEADQQLPIFNNIATNPHLNQVITNEGYDSLDDLPFTRILHPDAPSASYRRRKTETKSVIHWGQREAVILAIEFIMDFSKDQQILVYSGNLSLGAVRFISELFPNVHLHIYDDNTRVDKFFENVTIYKTALGIDTAQKWQNQEVLFISDVKTTKLGSTERELNDILLFDLDRQRALHDTIKPFKSMLKFRLPWEAGATEYLNGEFRFPIWGPVTTTETRLIPSEGIIQFDHSKYEGQMFYFNVHRRVARYNHPLVGTEGMDFCYDCKAEAEIFMKYSRIYRDLTSTYCEKQSRTLSERLSRYLGHRKLSDLNPDPDVLRAKQRFLQKRKPRQNQRLSTGELTAKSSHLDE
eukprot:gene1790-4900_t